MDTKNNLKFAGNLASICEYLELTPVFKQDFRKVLQSISISDIECDTRKIIPDCIYYAKKGAHYNPFEHMDEIRKLGAVAVLLDPPQGLRDVDTQPYSSNAVTADEASDLSFDTTSFGDRNLEPFHNEDYEQNIVAEGEDYAGSIQNMTTMPSALIRPRQAESFKAEEIVMNQPGVATYATDPSGALADFALASKTAEFRAVTDAHLIPIVLPRTKSLSALAGFICDNPSHKLKLIGITGTNGKSTVANLIAQSLDLMGHRCAIFGTLGHGFLGEIHKSANTTLDAISLQHALRDYVEQGADYAVMEVSSIGYCEGRVSGLKFYAGAFTNLSRDHLDYHHTMEEYFAAKLRILSLFPSARTVINSRNAYGERALKFFSSALEVAVANRTNDKTTPRFINAYRVMYHKSGLELFFKTKERSQKTHSAKLALLGKFNAENYVTALGVLIALGFDFEYLLSLASSLRPITGRMECFTKEHAPRLIVDYAHTPDGVEQALRAAREHTQDQGRIFVVLGCGGDRDRGKRPLMAMKASVYADQAIFTADNPRSESLDLIIEDMLMGIQDFPVQRYDDEGTSLEEDATSSKAKNNGQKNVIVIPNRHKAIEYAFKHASEHDCVVIAGKGHEDYQIFAERTIHFSDREVCCELLGIDLAVSRDLPQDEAKTAKSKSRATKAKSAKVANSEDTSSTN